MEWRSDKGSVSIAAERATWPTLLDNNGDIKMTMQAAIKALAKKEIVTLTDLDTYSLQHPYTDQQGCLCIGSRYKTLKALVGENAAISLLHELATQQCT
jgi:hypothetical protein